MTNPSASRCDRRQFLRLGSAAAAGSLVSLPAFGAGKAKPNVLFIMTDQQHFDTIAAGGCSQTRTPAMDRLVKGGTRFAMSYSANPLCSPARSAMLTGRPTTETGVYMNNLAIRRTMPNMGQWLAQEGGYDCVYAGKWHLPGTHMTHIPGFRVLTTALMGQGNLGDTFTSRACAAYLRNRPKEKPFCMVASFMQPHDICEWLRLNSKHWDKLPYPELRGELPPLPANFNFDTKEPSLIAGRRRGNEGVRNQWSEEQWRYYLWAYYRHVEMVDAEIGRVLDALERNGYGQDTLIVFTADHGEGTAHHQNTRKNNLYDEAARVPLIFSLPGEIGASRLDSQRVVCGMDILPTVCDFAGVATPQKVRGHSLKGVLTGGNAPGGDFCIGEVQGDQGRMVRTAEYKLITYKDDPVSQLFDMRSDPGETRNLIDDAKHADTVRDLRGMLRDWERRLDGAPSVPNQTYWRG
jgi:arylsulfatase A-like enzyme